MAKGAVDEIEDFDESPRPAKRRRGNTVARANGGPKKNAKSTVRGGRSGSTTSNTLENDDSDDDDDDDDDYDGFETMPRRVVRGSNANDSESDQDAPVKKPKHRIHITENGTDMTEIFVTQAPPQSSNPDRIRGPIWLKRTLEPVPAQVQKPAASGGRQPQQGSSISRPALVPTKTAPIFKPAVAKPLQHSVSHQSSVVRPPMEKPSTDPSNSARPAARVATVSAPPKAPVYDFSLELADLPSDAFSSASENSPRQTVDVFQQTSAVVRQPQLRGPQTGLKQTTLLGGLARPDGKDISQPKKHAWPLATQQEAPTHHKLDQDAMSTWVYPVNLGTIRDYQYNIVSAALYHNLLVALPTGLGKTFIAATVMLNWFRWTTDAQIVFLAPTKPLVAQQVDACFHICGIPRSQTVMLTGGISPGLRAEEWKDKRVFFMTPQTMINDLKTGICDPKRIVLVVVDEAHRATGSYSYVEVVKFIRRFNSSFRVLALTATPGSKVETVQQVIDGLDISRIEIRTEQSLDIRRYVHMRETETFVFDYSPEQEMVMDLCSKAIKPVLDKLNGQNAYWLKDPMKLTAFGLTQAARDWSKSEAGRKAPMPLKAMVHTIFQILSSLAHSISMLKFHGIGPFFRGMTSFKNAVDNKETKGKYATQIRHDENFGKMMSCMQGWMNHADFIGHPKLAHLRSVVLNHFMDAGEGMHGDRPPSATRVMVFAQFRDSAEEIARVLKRNDPMIRPHVFVGQADSKTSEGMGQKKQLEVIQQFKDGIYNTLVATSIGEEGLDIGEVDLIVCYDSNASPIRMLQRMGRTGRKRKGNIAILLMRDKEERDWLKAKDNYEAMQAMIASGDRFTFHDDRSPRILPKDIRPMVDKRVVEIPPENSQTDLPEPKKGTRRAPKRPPKKFFMPDNVRTGFVKVSRMDASDVEDQEEEEDEEGVRPKARSKKTGTTMAVSTKRNRPATPPPEPAPLPFLEDVLLNKGQEKELERKYQYVNENEDNAIVMAPRPDKYPEALRTLGRTKYVGHGKVTRQTADMMKRIHSFDDASLQSFKDRLDKSDLQDAVEDILVSREGTPICDDLPVAKPLPVRAQETPLPVVRGRNRYRTTNSAMEAESSSPEPTPADMRIGTQGIDLGSGDTSGEDIPDGEPDSELASFVVGSDQPIEYASSSMPQSAVRGRHIHQIFSSQQSRVSRATDDDLPEVGSLFGKKTGAQRRKNTTVDGSEESDAPVRKRQRRKVVMEDSDDG